MANSLSQRVSGLSGSHRAGRLPAIASALGPPHPERVTTNIAVAGHLLARPPSGPSCRSLTKQFIGRSKTSTRRLFSQLGPHPITATATPRDMGDAAFVDSATGSSFELDQKLEKSTPMLDPLGAWLTAVWKFSRPHTMKGTSVAICSVAFLAVDSTADVSVRLVTGIFQALIPALLMNIYIVGLNQLYDIEIDKMNKPELPLASGELSIPMGQKIVAAAAVLSVGIGVAVGSAPLLYTLIGCGLLGTAYSIDLPFLRWKRFPVMAAACILAVRAFAVQLGFYLHTKVFVLRKAPILSRPLIFATCFMCLFSIVIALFKDIPDVEGDRQYGMLSFSVQLGQKRIFWLCIWILTAAYAGAIGMGLASSHAWSKVATAVTHSVAVATLWRKARNLDLKNLPAVRACYLFIWQLFYVEYLFLPFLR